MKSRILLLAVGAIAASGKDGMARLGGPKLSPPAVAPAGVTDLTARALTDSAIVLQWTEVRSSSTSIPRYVVRYDLSRAFSWGTAQDLLTMGCGAPIVGANTTGGRFHACVIWNLLPNKAYQFQMVAYTGTLNSTAVFGPLSNIAEATTMTRVGPMLVSRPRMFRDSVTIASASIPDFGEPHYPLAGRFQLGDRLAYFYDSAGALTARGYLLVTQP